MTAYTLDRRIITGHQALKAAIRGRVTTFVLGEWNGLGVWRDADIERFVESIAPVVQSGQRQVATLTTAYLDALVRAAGFAPMPPADALMLAELRGGTATAEVYHRAGVETWTALSQGQGIGEAVRLGGVRLRELVSMDLQLAGTWASRGRLAGDKRVVGYRRVLGPGNNCVLCVLASTQRYRREDLLPIHNHCTCDVAPIIGRHDPGQVISSERREAVAEQMEGAPEMAVREHGEYGPILTWADHAFTGPGDL